MSDRQQAHVGVLLIIVIAGVLLAAPGLGLGLVLLWWAKHGWQRVVLGAGGLAGMMTLYVLRERMLFVGEDVVWAVVDADTMDAVMSVGHLWLLTLPTAPVFACVLGVVRLRNPERAELDAEHRKDAVKERRRDRARRKVAMAPEQIDGELVLGAAAEGDLTTCVRGDYFILPMDMLKHHLIAIGASGEGKTETFLRIAVLVAKLYGWKVVYLDFKGDQKTAQRFAQVMGLAGKRVAVYPNQPYDGWRGDAKQLCNRLLEVIEYTEPYYASIAKLMIQLACYAPQGPPRSSAALLERLRKPKLAELYADRPEAEEVAGIADKDAKGVYNRYRSFLFALGQQLDGQWAFEDVDACYLAVDATSLKEDGRSLGRYLFEDFTQYATYRKPEGQRVLFVVDELSAISKADMNIDGLFERMRSWGAHLIVSAQGYAGLGEEAERMLDAAGGTILHAMTKPDELIGRAGTMKVVERSVQKNTLGATGMGSLRAQEAFRVNPNDVGHLRKGECFIISKRRSQWVKVKMVELAPVVVRGHTRSVGAKVGARYASYVPSAAGAKACEAPPTGQDAAPEPTSANYDPNGDWTVRDAVPQDATAPEGEAFAP